MENIKDVLTDEVKSFQDWARGDLDPQVRWFATLDLESATIEGERITFVFRDPKDSTRHGWRWEILPRERWGLLHAHLHEDMAMTDPTDPDESGVRWWGVNAVDENRPAWWEHH